MSELTPQQRLEIRQRHEDFQKAVETAPHAKDCKPIIRTEYGDGEWFYTCLAWPKQGILYLETMSGERRVDFIKRPQERLLVLKGIKPETGKRHSEADQARLDIFSEEGKHLIQAWQYVQELNEHTDLTTPEYLILGLSGMDAGAIVGLSDEQLRAKARNMAFEEIGQRFYEAVGSLAKELQQAPPKARRKAADRLLALNKAILNHVASGRTMNHRKFPLPSNSEKELLVGGQPRDLIVMKAVDKFIRQHKRLPRKGEIRTSFLDEAKSNPDFHPFKDLSVASWRKIWTNTGLKDLPK